MTRSQPQSLAAIIGGYIDPKPVTYRGVGMRSKLEADFAHHLDSLGIRWVYAPAIFGPRDAGYLPDFRLIRDDGWHFVELKPTLDQAEAAKTRIAIIWQTFPDAALIVVSAEESRWFASVAGGEWTSWVEGWRHA